MSEQPREDTPPYDLVIIGSGPAGVSAARAYRDAGGTGSVVMLSADVDAPYERPPLTKEVLAGEQPPEGQPIDGEGLPEDVESRLGVIVVSVDPDERAVRLASEVVPYRRLVVATGSRPKPLPGVEDGADVHLLRSLEQARSLVDAAEESDSAVVIGSGFIGCEAAASLSRRGVRTTLVTPEDAPHESRLGEEAAARLRRWLTDAGVELWTGVQVTAVRASGTVDLDDGSTLDPDLVLVAIGVEQNGHVLRDTSATLRDGRVVADATLSAAPGIWVAGDVALAHHAVADRPLAVEHWGDALTMGEIAGHNVAVDERGGDRRVWDSPPGFWSTIGEQTLKYSAWGDGYATARMVDHGDGFTVWYGDEQGRVVGVLTHNADDDYERGGELIGSKAQMPPE